MVVRPALSHGSQAWFVPAEFNHRKTAVLSLSKNVQDRCLRAITGGSGPRQCPPWEYTRIFHRPSITGREGWQHTVSEQTRTTDSGPVQQDTLNPLPPTRPDRRSCRQLLETRFEIGSDRRHQHETLRTAIKGEHGRQSRRGGLQTGRLVKGSSS